jgi:hypothetical protein
MDAAPQTDKPDRDGIYIWIYSQGRYFFVGMNKGAGPSDAPYGGRFCFVGEPQFS